MRLQECGMTLVIIALSLANCGHNLIILLSDISLLLTRSLGTTRNYLTIRPVALSGYGSIAHEAKPNGLLIRGP